MHPPFPYLLFLRVPAVVAIGALTKSPIKQRGHQRILDAPPADGAATLHLGAPTAACAGQLHPVACLLGRNDQSGRRRGLGWLRRQTAASSFRLAMPSTDCSHRAASDAAAHCSSLAALSSTSQLASIVNLGSTQLLIVLEDQTVSYH